MNFKRFVPNKKETFVCSLCPHAFDRHIFGGGMIGCMVSKCRCTGLGATFTRPVPPVLVETVTDLKTHKRVTINQPAPPPAVGGV